MQPIQMGKRFGYHTDSAGNKIDSRTGLDYDEAQASRAPSDGSAGLKRWEAGKAQDFTNFFGPKGQSFKDRESKLAVGDPNRVGSWNRKQIDQVQPKADASMQQQGADALKKLGSSTVASAMPGRSRILKPNDMLSGKESDGLNGGAANAFKSASTDEPETGPYDKKEEDDEGE